MTIQFLPRITVELSADEWDLYDTPDRDEAARTLSTAAGAALTQAWALMAGLHPVSIIDAHRYALEQWEKVADRLDDVGASDTEPRARMATLARDYLLESPGKALDQQRRAAH
ncbi:MULTISPECIES: hypothetical protein [Burkholderiaceae]|uniref:hypothetical protein n=1 Tax=Burkholderiaceae TaxID=119060 RepID=UPI0002A234D8|nr:MULTISPECIES: hypothetical protein [Burkholderiaceae]EKZ97851.1 hypothetical protein D769_18074 [Cupriavidus sp. HMR-1]KVS16374.1 hypothetical protein WK32_26800 [Burkholderia vietnamiensis]MDR8057750.1 hypothetical protein [Burkholderia cenocepacia]MDR8062158.1 hypothetical protein [Burkholderia cenocepacia]